MQDNGDPIGAQGNVLDLERVTEHDGIFVSKEIAGRTVWDQLAEEDPLQAVISAESEEQARIKSDAQIDEIESRVAERTVLLDVGCGYGRIAKYLLTRRKIGIYVGVDSSFQMLRLFRERYRNSDAEGRSPALFVNSDISKMPLLENSIDFAVVSAVFLHNHKPVVRAATQEIERVLKPDATLLVFSSFPRRATAMGLQGWAYHTFLSLQGRGAVNGPVRYYSKNEVLSLFSGFSQTEVVPTGFELIPKSLIGVQGAADRVYRRYFSGPMNEFFQKLVPSRWQPAFARHYDVVARK